MAQFFPNRTRCALCGETISSADEMIGFAAFLPQGHKWARYSDGCIHQECFKKWPFAQEFEELHQRFRGIWKEAATREASGREKWLIEELNRFNEEVLASGC